MSLDASETSGLPEVEDATPALEPSVAEPEEASAPPEPEAPESAPGAAPAAPATARDAPAVPAMPAMPDMPGEAVDDDDDFEIPDAEGYDEILKPDAQAESRSAQETANLIQGVVVGVRKDGVFVDVGQKSEAFLPIEPGAEVEKPPAVGETIEVLITGQSPEGYPILSSLKTQRPKGWAQLEAAFSAGTPVLGEVIDVVRSGLTVDVGVRAFLPASRSGERTDEGMRALVGERIRARILELSEVDRNVVLDRRVVVEEERAKERATALARFKVGDEVQGTVRSLRKFGAFVDLGGIDALLHVSDIAHERVEFPGDVLTVGQELTVKILKLNAETQRIAVGLRQLQAEPWSVVAERIQPNDRIRGEVVRLKDFGAFVQVLPGVQGLVHISHMSHSRRVRHPSDIVKVGDTVEALVLDVKPEQRRISLSLKEALGDPWEKLATEHPVDSVVTGIIRKITSFGAFIEIVEGVDGLLHISDITSERRLNSPAEMLSQGQEVRVKILEVDPAKRRLKLGMKQLEPSQMDTFLAGVEVGDTVTGRVIKIQGRQAIVEVGDGVRGVCTIKPHGQAKKGVMRGQTSDLSSLKSMLESAWKEGDEEPSDSAEQPLTPGSVHQFKITKLNAEAGTIELVQV